MNFNLSCRYQSGFSSVTDQKTTQQKLSPFPGTRIEPVGQFYLFERQSLFSSGLPSVRIFCQGKVFQLYQLKPCRNSSFSGKWKRSLYECKKLGLKTVGLRKIWMDNKLKILKGPWTLLHLVSKYQMDIYDVPCAVIEQYLACISTLQVCVWWRNYMVMASRLMLIKSQLLVASDRFGRWPRAGSPVSKSKNTAGQALRTLGSKHQEQASTIQTP